MLRSITLALAATVAVALGACGSGQDETAARDVTPETAKSRVERAAKLELAAEPVPAEAREQGLQASYSNAGTALKDKQIVGLFVMRDAEVADTVSDMVRGSAPESAELIVNGKFMVVYAAAGADRTSAVERAVKAL